MNERIIDYIKNKNNLQLEKIILSHHGTLNLEETFYETAINAKNISAIKFLCKKDNKKKKLINYFYRQRILSPNLLQFLLNCGYKIEPYFIKECTYSKKYDLFKVIVDHFIFNEELILKLIFYHKKKKPLSKQELRNLIRYKLHELDISQDWNDGFLCLNRACKIEDELSVKYLVTLGANVNGGADQDITPLTIACLNGNFSLVKFLVEHGANVNKIDEVSKAPLINTIKSRRLKKTWDKKLTGYLIDVGADILRGDYNSENALTYSCKYEDIDVVNYLLERLDEKDDIKIKYRDMALLAACQSSNDNELLIKQLVEQGADVKIVNKNGDTTLIMVIRSSYYRLFVRGKNLKANVIQYLIDQGVDVNKENNLKQTALSIACEINDRETVDFLIRHGAIVDLENKSLLNTALHFESIINCFIENKVAIPVKKEILFIACRKYYANLVKYLIDQGIDINQTNGDGDTPLIMSCRHYYKSCDIIKYLIDGGADINKENKNNETPFSITLYNKRKEKMNYLINHGVDVNKGIIKGYVEIGNHEIKTNLNPLFYVCSSPFSLSLTLIKSLVEHGADVNTEDSNGFTPLNLLCLNFKVESSIITYLIDHGADVNKENKNGYTPLMWSLKKFNPDVIDYLLENGADINKENRFGDTILHKVCRLEFRGYEKNDVIVRYLIEKGASINKRNKDGDTPLAISCKVNDFDTVKCLTEMGADINIENKNGGTPLMIACKIRAFESVKYLVDHGADVNHKKGNGKTALFEACTCRQTNQLAIVKYLVEHGSDINAVNHHGDTPLIFACKNGNNEEVIRYLIDSGAKINEKNNKGFNALMAADCCFNRNESIINYLIEKGCNKDENL